MRGGRPGARFLPFPSGCARKHTPCFSQISDRGSEAAIQIQTHSVRSWLLRSCLERITASAEKVAQPLKEATADERNGFERRRLGKSERHCFKKVPSNGNVIMLSAWVLSIEHT